MRVEGGSLSAVNPAVRQARAIEMLGTIVPVLNTFGYDTEPALRHIVRDLGYDPDIFLVKTSAPTEMLQPGTEMLPPEQAGATPSPEEIMALLAAQTGGAVPPTMEEELLAGPAEFPVEAPPDVNQLGLI